MSIEINNNKRIADQISEMLSSGRVFQAFLFYSGSRQTREEIGLWLSEKILCTDDSLRKKFEHGNLSDFIIVEKPEDRESIVKEQILDLIEKTGFKPFYDKYVILIKDAEKMNETAQNKLLKLLEEPTAETVFILLSEREDALLSTIRSRCTVFCLEEADMQTNAEILQAAKNFSSLVTSGSAYYKKKAEVAFILNNKDNSRETAIEFLSALEDCLRPSMSSSESARNAIIQAEKTIKYLKQSHNTAYSVKQFCLRV